MGHKGEIIIGNLQIFSNEEFGEVRTILKGEEIRFVANDVARALGYTNPSKATKDHCKKAEMIWGNDSLGRRQEFKTIPESDLYRLIIKSKLESAEKFEVWVFEEVLPSIRKHGGYIMNQENMSADEIMARGLLAAQSIIEEKNKQIEEMTPKAAFADQVSDSKDAIDIGSFAKVVKDEHINIGRNKLFDWLRNKGFLMNNNVPYQRYIDNNWFKVIELTKDTCYGVKCFTKTLITGRGQINIVEKLRAEIGN